MALVISDSSTLIHLSQLERLDLLPTFFQQITIPTAVWREVVEQGGQRAGAAAVTQARQDGWLVVETPSNRTLLQLLKRDLDDGEAEMIALAIEREAELVLADETEARRVAERYNLSKTGVIGLLIRARQAGQIPSLKTELDKLRNQGGFWIEQGLYERVLRAVGE
jgi:predicted nucleic acid-binding protein